MKDFPEIIDNRMTMDDGSDTPFHQNIVTLGNVLDEVCKMQKHSRVRIAVGFFSPYGWKILSEGFQKLLENDTCIDILLGSKYEVERTDEFQLWFQTRLENLPLNIAIQKHILDLIEFLKNELVRFAVLSRPFVHAKLYWFPEIAYVGSSNLTAGGLRNNIELNLRTIDSASLIQLADWFDKRFQIADLEYKEILINALQDCKLGTREWTPFEVFLKIIYEHYKRNLEYDVFQFSINLASFQKEAVIRGLDAVSEFGGVMLADAVGLGKSFEGIEVLEALRRKNPTLRRVLIICPAQLRGNWERYDEIYSLGARIYTMEMLSRSPPRGKFDILLIDESHNLRHSQTARWQNLKVYLSNLPETKVILLTATPVNTSMNDLYNQILVITKYLDAYPPLTRIGIPDLNEFFNNVKMGDDVSRLRDALIVTRNRTEIRYRQAITGEDLFLPDGRRLVFPDRKLFRADYSIVSEGDAELFFTCIGELVESLTFPQYVLRLFEVDFDENEKTKVQTAVGMIKILLLKRLESSLPAAMISLKKQQRLLQLLMPALKKGYILNAEIADRLCNLAFEIERDDLQDSDSFSFEIVNNDAVEEIMEAVIAGEKELSIFRYVKETESNYDLANLSKSIDHDTKAIDEIITLLEDEFKKEDSKLEHLYSLIKKNAFNEEKKNKILIFSYFKDTLVYLYENLKSRLDELGIKSGVVHGGVQPTERYRLVRAFAPISNTIEDEMLSGIAEKQPDIEDEIDILFSTDVLSEGQNLQDAGFVINYDLHWNPVRLIQRIGRIDRLGSLHKLIHAYNFFPEEGLEDLIRIIERLESRLADIDLITPSDAPILRPEEDTIQNRQQQRRIDMMRIREEDVSVLDSFEERVGLVGLSESRKALIEFLERHQKEYFDRIPLGIHSGFRTGKIPGLMVAIRILRGDAQPLTMWGFKPDEGTLEDFPHLKRIVPNHGIITHMSFIERQIMCSQDTPRHLPDDTTVRGELFEEVVSVAKVLVKSLDIGIEIQETFAKTKYPRGNRRYAVFIRQVTTQDPILRAQCRPFLSLLAARDLSGMRKFLGKIMRDFDSRMKVLEVSMKKGSRKSRYNAKEEAKNLLRSFIPQVKAYIDKYAITKAETSSARLIKPKYELIGFLRLFAP